MSRHTMLRMFIFATLALVPACNSGGGGPTNSGESTAPARTDSEPWEGRNPGECDDGADNDGDGLPDCSDADCSGAPVCTDSDTPETSAGGQGEDTARSTPDERPSKDETTRDDPGGGDADTPGNSAPEVDGFASFPFLEMADPWGDELVFPTYLAHLIGDELEQFWWSGDFACAWLTNVGPAEVSLVVEAELVGYSEAVSELVELNPSETVEVCLNPIPNLQALYSLTSETNAQARVRANDAAEGGLLWQATGDVRVAPRRNVWWTLSGIPARESVAALVRPDATQVIELLDDMVELSAFGGTVGVGGYRAESQDHYWPEQSINMVAGGYAYWPFFIEEGRTLSFFAESNGADSWGYVMDDDSFSKLAEGEEFLVYWQEELDELQFGWFTAPTTGWFYLVAYNYSSFLSETVTWQRTMTRADNVIDYLRIVYEFLQGYGINYINVPGTFFDDSQECLLPDEVLTSGGGNCIDGTVLFASLLEQLGVRPVITYAPGHAFIGVDSGPSGYNVIWPLETTVMGDGLPFWDALNLGIDQRLTANFDYYYYLDVYVDEARSAGVLPMP